ncbi:MAG: M48 family metalloprotease [Bacteroidota bacterium]
MLQQANKQYQQDLATVSGEWTKEKKALLVQRFAAVKHLFDDKQPLTDTLVTAYFYRLLSVVKKSNKTYDFSKIRLVVSSSYIPNAASYGEGTIVFNAGLFCRLQNEAQAAFVLCHELAHYFLNHSNKQIDSYLSSLYSKETQAQLKHLNHEEYNKNARLEKLATTIVFGSKRHNRLHESQSDSMAIVLMQKTGFDLNESIHCLEVLDSVDSYKYNNTLELKQRFSSDTFAFRDAWIKKQTGLGVMASTLEKSDSIREDSLRTHPDIPQRIHAIKTMLSSIQSNKGKAFLIDAALFKKLQADFDFEMIEYCYQSNQVSRALLYSLQMLTAFPENSYLYSMTGKCLVKCYYKQKEHHLDDITERPSPTFDEAYSSLLRMLNTIRLDDLAQVSDVWAQKYRSRFENDEGYLFLLIENAGINNRAEKQELINRYQNLFARRPKP